MPVMAGRRELAVHADPPVQYGRVSVETCRSTRLFSSGGSASSSVACCGGVRRRGGRRRAGRVVGGPGGRGGRRAGRRPRPGGVPALQDLRRRPDRPVARRAARRHRRRGRRSPGSRSRWRAGGGVPAPWTEPCLQMVTRAELDAWLLSAGGSPPGRRCGCPAGWCRSSMTSSRPRRSAARVGRDRRRRHVRAGWPATSASGSSQVDLGLELELDAGAHGGGVGGPGAPGLGTDPGVLRLGVPQGRHPHRRRDRRPGRGRRDPAATCATSCAGSAWTAPRRPRLRPPDSLPHRRTRRSAGAGCCSPATPPGCSSRGPARASRSPPAPVPWPARPPRRGRRAWSSATAPPCPPSCCPRWPPANAACAPSRPGRWAFHELIRSTPVGWQQFCRITRGDTTLARAVRRRPVPSSGLAMLSLGSGRVPRH